MKLDATKRVIAIFMPDYWYARRICIIFYAVQELISRSAEAKIKHDAYAQDNSDRLIDSIFMLDHGNSRLRAEVSYEMARDLIRTNR